MGGLSRGSAAVVLGLLALLVNLPVAHGAWNDRLLDRDGVRVRAEVVGTSIAGDGGRVGFRLPADVDPERRTWAAVVDADARRAADDAGVIGVLVRPGHPATYRVEGERRGRGLLAATLLADVVLLGGAGLLLLRRRVGDDDPTAPVS